MKKRVLQWICILLLSCTACSMNTSSVKIKEVKSDVYSQQEIHSAIDTIIKEMDKNWDGCTLKEIYYVGDESLETYRDLVEDSKKDVIALMSSFDVDKSGGDGSLEPNSTYAWAWILKKDAKGHWTLVDHGFA